MWDIIFQPPHGKLDLSIPIDDLELSYLGMKSRKFYNHNNNIVAFHDLRISIYAYKIS